LHWRTMPFVPVLRRWVSKRRPPGWPLRVSRTDGLRELLIAAREYRLPKSPPPPKWSAPAGWPDERLDALKAGEAVRVGSSELLGAFIDADMPRSSYARWCYGGDGWRKSFLLDEADRLTEWEPQ
jgi:hypothetical protein